MQDALGTFILTDDPPDDPPKLLAAAHSSMESALLNLDRPKDALRSFERALSIDPAMQYAINNRKRARTMLQGKNE